MEIIGNPINIATLTLLYVAYQQSIGLLEAIIYPPSSLTFNFYTLNWYNAVCVSRKDRTGHYLDTLVFFD